MARKPAPDDKPLSRRTLVNIHRDSQTVTPRVVWSHEIPVLEAIFGEGLVRPVDPETLDEGYTARPSANLLVHNKRQDLIRRPSESMGLGYVFINDARAEYERLAAAYGKHVDVNVSNTEHVFGRFRDGLFERVIGKPEIADLPDDQLRALVVAYGYLVPDSTFESDAEDRRLVAEKRAAFAKLSHDELVKIAIDVGVEIG